MSFINQVNNLSSPGASNLSCTPNTDGVSSETDWFTCSFDQTEQAITASPIFANGTTLDEMSLSILSCIGIPSKP